MIREEFTELIKQLTSLSPKLRGWLMVKDRKDGTETWKFYANRCADIYPDDFEDAMDPYVNFRIPWPDCEEMLQDIIRRAIAIRAKREENNDTYEKSCAPPPGELMATVKQMGMYWKVKTVWDDFRADKFNAIVREQRIAELFAWEREETAKPDWFNEEVSE